MRMTQFQLGTARIRTGWSEGPIRQSGYPPTDDPHIPSRNRNKSKSPAELGVKIKI